MLTTIETFDLSRILQPVQRPEDARQDAQLFAPSQTILRGTAIGVKTADRKGYIMVPGAGDGTQLFVGFSMYDFITDAAGLVFFGQTIAAASTVRIGPWTTAPIWRSGIFDPQELQTKGTPTGEVDTFTPGGTITTGDINIITFSGGPGAPQTASFTVGGTTTAAAVVTGLIAAWNANPTLAAIGVASGTVTFIVTSVNTGTPLNLTSSVTGVGTLTRVQTTAPAGRAIADIIVGRPGAYVMHNGFWFV